MSHNTSNPRKPQHNSYEHKCVHPATAEWLTANGFSFHHEFKVPVGRIDFLANHEDGRQLIVECKSDCYSLNSALRQILDYHRHLGESYQCVLVVPNWSITDQAVKACEVRKIILIGVDTPKPEVSRNFGIPAWMDRLVFYEDILQLPQKMIHEISVCYRPV